MFEHSNQDFAHALLGLLILSESIEDFSHQSLGFLALGVKSLKSSNKAVGILSDAHGEDWQSSAHREANFLIGPIARMKTRVQERDQGVTRS